MTTRSGGPLRAALVALTMLGALDPLLVGSALAQEQEPGAPFVSSAVRFAVSPPLRDVAAAETVRSSASIIEDDLVSTKPIKTLPGELLADAWAPSLDDVVQDWPAVEPLTPAPSMSFAGISSADNNSVYGFRISPPDTVGDVGPSHYVQAVNNLMRVYDKAGTPLTAVFRMSSLFTALGTTCSSRDDGDPIVLYDPLADRWLASQFCITVTDPNNHQMIAISQTGDPTGAYFLYDFMMPNIKLNDYPKFGVWPDAYYMSDNQFNQAQTMFLGAGVFAFERAKMLAGDPSASFVYFDLSSNKGGLLPADLDGSNPPPLGQPCYFSQYLSTIQGDAVNGLRIFEFHVDFATPANSTFSERADSPVAVAAFDPRNPNGRNDIEQPPAVSVNVDSIQDRLMFRLQYRNFGSHESLVTTHTVNVSGLPPIDPASHQAAIRYYELRRSLPGGSFAVSEQATFAPDTDNRWMGSAAMDGQGNLAVGYSVSSTATFPSMRYAARLATDAPGGLFQGETTLIAGTGVQRSALGRWGDYSAMSVDPVDDCTFWYTNEYYTAASQATSAVGWLTRVGSFRFPECTRLSVSAQHDQAAFADFNLVGRTVVFSHRLTNTGSTSDSYDVTAFNESGWELELIDPGTAAVIATDSNGDGVWDGAITVNTGSLAPGAKKEYLLQVTVPGLTPLDTQSTSRLTATSVAQPSVQAFATDEITVRNDVRPIVVEPDNAGAVTAGASAVYTHRVVNNTGLLDAFSLRADSGQATPCVLLPPLCWTATIHEDTKLDGVYTSGVDLAIANTAPLAAGTFQTIFVVVTASPLALPDQVDVTHLTATSTNDSNKIGAATDTTTVVVATSHDLSGGGTRAVNPPAVNPAACPGPSCGVFPGTIQSLGGATDAFAFRLTASALFGLDAFNHKTQLWIDTTGNGIPDTPIATDTNGDGTWDVIAPAGVIAAGPNMGNPYNSGCAPLVPPCLHLNAGSGSALAYELQRPVDMDQTIQREFVTLTAASAATGQSDSVTATNLLATGRACRSSTCDDGNACNGVETCNRLTGACQPGVPMACDDGNACNGVEACDSVSGCAPGNPPTWDDGDTCTADACDPVTGLSHTPISADDGDACTADACDPITGPSHTPIDVDDGNACTADACDPSTGPSHIPISVDDGNACTADACDPITGPSHTPISVDDGSACTADVCDPVTGLSHTPISVDDGNACTADACDPLTGPSHAPISVDDGDACTADACDPITGPSHTPVSVDDGNACTADACDPIAGPSHTPISVDDGNACTADACDPVTGPSHTTISLDDGDACTADTCHPITGPSHTPISADDGNACTADACDPVTGPSHTTISLDDGDACTADTCHPITGPSHTPISADDGNACTADACDPITGPSHTTISVDDGNACTADACDPITGPSYTPISVDDGDACTADACDPITGPSHTPIDIDDGNACTADACDPITGPSHTPIDIDDGNACTADACYPIAGPSHTPISVDDGDACTADACDPITGPSHTPISVDDGNACTADACDPVTGPSHAPISVDDGNACTADACDPLTGPSHTPISVDDGNACTADACDPLTGPSHTTISVDDGNACTADACDPVTGLSHTTISVDDGNACTADACDPITGPSHTPISVDDGDACTADACDPTTGVSHVPAVCNDNNSCTDDTCNPASGSCSFTPNAACATPPHIRVASADLQVESCQLANGVPDPDERVTYAVTLTNGGGEATTDLVATLQPSASVSSPGAPQSFGAIAPGASATRSFSWTGLGMCGGSWTASLALFDAAQTLPSVSFDGVYGLPGPSCSSGCATIRVVTTAVLTRMSSTKVQAAITVTNTGSLPANNVRLTTAKLNTANGTPLPQSLGTVPAGESTTAIVVFTYSGAGATTLKVGGSHTGGSFSTSGRIAVP